MTTFDDQSKVADEMQPESGVTNHNCACETHTIPEKNSGISNLLENP
jgi:hypothetical protein